MKTSDRTALSDRWKRLLGGDFPALQVPADRLRSGVRRFAGAVEHRELPISQWERLQRVGADVEASASEWFLSAFQTLLFRYTGEARFSYGWAHDAHLVEGEGLFAYERLLWLTADVSGELTFFELVQRNRDLVGQAKELQGQEMEQSLLEAGLAEEVQVNRPRVLFAWADVCCRQNARRARGFFVWRGRL